MKYYFSLLFLWFFLPPALAQKPLKQNSSEIYESLQKLNFLGSVLYVAAHPDDENTRLISYFSNHVKARTAYLSLTRGDGGQNLIGPELRELLGVIRTQELLAARGVDGGEQFFTRANDFGYSKHPDETLTIWNKDEVLKDVVSVIRKFKPDLIVNRFDHKSAGRTHGHHTSSAMLSMEAFDLANDKNYTTHFGDTWQPKRLFFNTHWWFYGSREKFAEADKSNMLKFDTGVYYPFKGLSNNELASIASSQHLCQGFGRLTIRGSEDEYIELLKGDLPKNGDPFEGIDTSWNRVKGGKAIGAILNAVEKNFNFRDPSIHVPELLKASQLIAQLDDAHWKAIKLKQIKQIIASSLGLYLEASATSNYANPNGTAELNIEGVNRSGVQVKLISASYNGNTFNLNEDLLNNKKYTSKQVITVDPEKGVTSPYWLLEKGGLGMYAVKDASIIGTPETKPLEMKFLLEVNGLPLGLNRPIVRRYSKPDKGELYEPFQIVPEVTSSITEKVIIFADGTPKDVAVKVKANAENISAQVSLNHPDGWSVSPASIPVTIAQKGGETTVIFKVSPSSIQSEGKLYPVVTYKGKEYKRELIEISYDHIPKQSVLLASEAKVVRLDIEKKGQRIGYIQGAGDQIPESLRQIGYTVIELNDDQISADNLQNFDAVILGIRAYNVNERAKFYQKDLHSYVNNGGTLIVQYNTSRRQVVEKVAPYDLKLSRDRVTDENSEVTILNPDHEVMSYPNKISNSDFKGWVQERGLYFPSEWSQEFIPLLAMNDLGEPEKKGSLLVAKHGDGHFIYTGLSFFRELPAGVPGAYRLFANLLSVGKNELEVPIKN